MENLKYGICGLGMMGGSIAMAIKYYINNATVYGFGKDIEKLEEAKKLGIIDAYGNEESDIIDNLDMFIIATPVSAIPQVFGQYVNNLPDKTIIMDIGSVKKNIIQEIKKLNKRGLSYIPTHPMVGSEKSGLDFARGDLFDQKIVAIITDNEDENINIVKDFWKKIGAQIVLISSEFHDEIVANTSHLPHIISSSIIGYLEKDGWADVKFFGLYGKGLLDTTRIAASNPEMWADILLMNIENIERSLNDYIKEIQHVRNILLSKNKKELIKYLQKSKEFRESL